MTINYKVGNIVDAIKAGEVQFVGHQANCFNTMRSGVAKALVEAFPRVEESDQRTIKGDKEKLGSYSLAHIFIEKTSMIIRVFNLYGQYNYGYNNETYTDYENLERALKEMATYISAYPNERNIGFPMIGAGLGGGDWKVISKMIEEIFSDHKVTIYVLNEMDLPGAEETELFK